MRQFHAVLLLSWGLLAAHPSHAQDEHVDPGLCIADVVPDSAETIIGSCTALLQSATLTESDRISALANRAIGHRLRGDLDSALADYDLALALDPNYPWAITGRAATYLERGQPDRALADLATGLPRLESAMRNGTVPEELGADRIGYAHLLRGMAHIRLENHLSAAIEFRRGMEWTPRDADLANGLCWSLAVSGGDLAEARAACDRSLNIRPNDARTLDSRGIVNLKQGQFEEAWQDYDAAVRGWGDQSHLASPLFGRGVAAMRLGQIAEGTADIERALLLEPEIARFYARYGIRP